MKKIFVVLAAIFLLAIIACSKKDDAPAGSSSATSTVQSDLQGTWDNGVDNITLMADGTYVMANKNSGTVEAWGTYSTTGNQLTINGGGSGIFSCFDTQTSTYENGTYDYSVSGKTLGLTLVSDSCSARTNTLTGGSWTGQSTSTPDTTAPSIPTNLSATAVSTSEIDLTWTAASDNVGVAGYKVFRNGGKLTTLVAVTAGTVFSDIGLTKNTPYSYVVTAYDAAGNDSGSEAKDWVTAFTYKTGNVNVVGTWTGVLTKCIFANDGTWTLTSTVNGGATGTYTVSQNIVHLTGTGNKNNDTLTGDATVSFPNMTINMTSSVAGEEDYYLIESGP